MNDLECGVLSLVDRLGMKGDFRAGNPERRPDVVASPLPRFFHLPVRLLVALLGHAAIDSYSRPDCSLVLVGLFPMQAVTKQFLFWSDWQNCGEAGVIESEIPQDWKMYDAGA